MRKPALYVMSHSSLDMVSTLNQYCANARQRDVTILVSSTRENLQFLEHVGIPATALRFLRFESRQAGSLRSVARYVRRMRADRRMLDELASEIGVDPRNELVFHSSDDPHFGYLVAKLAHRNPVTFIDTLEVERPALGTRDLCSLTGAKNLVGFALATAVFGRHYRLSGTPSYPILSLDVARLGVNRKPKSAGGTVATLGAFRYQAAIGAKSAFVLYADAFGADELSHAAAYRQVLDSLAARGFTIVVKVHPQSRTPDFFEAYRPVYVPKYVPFEFVDLSGVVVVIGLSGAALLCTGSIPTVSILPMLYERDSDPFRSAMEQLTQNMNITYVSSADELHRALAARD